MPDAQLDATTRRFSRRTWHHTDFDRRELAARRGGRVSVVIPALNEAETVAEVVGVAASMTDLVDEVVVVDGGSHDDTPTRALAAGARVVEQRSGPGKGGALADGLGATDGDVVVFLDADLHDADPRYVTGLLGPLVVEPDVGYVKACYDRPLRGREDLDPAGGGRVTELTARPLIAAFWPDLAFLAQPLAGEYAGRREVLETVPFEAGWGVEFGLLVDIAGAFGADAIAQVDLGTRLHSHQPLPALSRMAFEILHTAADRLQGDGRLADGVASSLYQPVRDERGRLTMRATDVRR